MLNLNPAITRKDKLFETFIDDYGHKLNQIKYIIDFLHSFPVMEKIINGPLIESDELMNHQKEWVYLCHSYDEEPENGFFKPYWVPLDMNYKYFIDIKDGNYPVFKFDHDCFHTRCYYRYKLIDNISDFLCDLSGFELKGKTKEYVKLFSREYFRLAPIHWVQNRHKVTPEKLLKTSQFKLRLDRRRKMLIGEGFTPEVIGMVNFINSATIQVVKEEYSDYNFIDNFEEKRFMLNELLLYFEPLHNCNFTEFYYVFDDYENSSFRYEPESFVLNHYNMKVLEYVEKNILSTIKAASKIDQEGLPFD